MASFPDSVPTFASKASGQAIQAAHVNDLQTEVTAICNGYLSGSARINSSHSTLATLSVPGGSTLGTVQAGASTCASLSVSGASTLATLSAGGSTLATLSVSGGSTFAGTAQFGDQTIQRPVLKDYAEAMSTGSVSGNALTVDMENGNTFDVSLSANVTSFTISNPPASGRIGALTLILRSGGSTRSFTWGSAVKWAGGTAPNLSTGADVVTLMTNDAGSTWFGFSGGLGFR